MIYLLAAVVGGLLLAALFRPELSERVERSKAGGKAKAWAERGATWWAPRAPAVKRALRVIAILLIAGQTVGFALFMYEEALQTVMFATWQAPRGSDRASLAQTYRAILNAGWATLYAAGWLNPLAWGPYHAYFRAAEEFYVNAFLRN